MICSNYTLKFVELYKDKNNSPRSRWLCKPCNQICTRLHGRPKKYDVKLRCKYCSQKNVGRRGWTYQKSGKAYNKRYFCYDCNRSFVWSYQFKVRRWGSKVSRSVKRLINTRALPHEVSVYDRRVDKNFLSSRAIVKRIRKKHGVKISDSTVSKYIKIHRNLDE